MPKSSLCGQNAPLPLPGRRLNPKFGSDTKDWHIYYKATYCNTDTKFQTNVFTFCNAAMQKNKQVNVKASHLKCIILSFLIVLHQNKCLFRNSNKNLDMVRLFCRAFFNSNIGPKMT